MLSAQVYHLSRPDDWAGLAVINKIKKSTDAQQNIYLISVGSKHLLYDKAIMSKFVGSIWDQQLNAESANVIKGRQITADMGNTYPILLRTETRRVQVLGLDFLPGRSARFMNFRKSVKFSSSAICLDCSDEVDSNLHKLFSRSKFHGPGWDCLVGLLGGCMYKEELVLFTGKEGDELRRSYKRDLISEIDM